MGYMLFTTTGNRIILEQVIKNYTKSESFVIKNLRGTFINGMEITDVQINDIKYLPAGNVFKIQQLFLQINSMRISDWKLEIENGRFLIPDSDPVIIVGSMKGGELDFNIYSKSVDIDTVKNYFSDNKKLSRMKGNIDQGDILIRGLYKNSMITGTFTIGRLSINGFTLLDTPGMVKLNCAIKGKNIRCPGDIVLSDGTIEAKRIIIKLKESKISLREAVPASLLALHGQAKISKTKINISVKGTAEKPELKLSSDPPLPEWRLLAMLATGKGWKGVEPSLEQGAITPELAQDFLDYFVFGGVGSKFRQRLGLSDVSLTYDQNKKGIGIKKQLSEKAEIGYGVEQQKNGKNGQADVNQKLQGEYKMTDNISLELEKDIKTKGDPLESTESTGNNDENKVFLKYKKKF